MMGVTRFTMDIPESDRRDRYGSGGHGALRGRRGPAQPRADRWDGQSLRRRFRTSSRRFRTGGIRPCLSSGVRSSASSSAFSPGVAASSPLSSPMRWRKSSRNIRRNSGRADRRGCRAGVGQQRGQHGGLLFLCLPWGFPQRHDGHPAWGLDDPWRYPRPAAHQRTPRYVLGADCQHVHGQYHAAGLEPAPDRAMGQDPEGALSHSFPADPGLLPDRRPTA